MSDTATHGEEAPVAPVGAASTSPAAPASTEQAAPSAPAFGTSRGSGLARGKRATSNATADTNAKGNYAPTAIQVVHTEREYKNPFATPTETAENTQVAAEPPQASQPAPVVATPTVDNTVEAKVELTSSPATNHPAPVAQEEDESQAPAELKILPPEEKPRTAQSWQSSSFPAEQGSGQRHQGRQGQGDRGERPVFQPERRDRYESRDGQRRERRDQRDQRDQRPNENRPAAPAPAPVPEPKKSGGFFGWLKGLFGGSSDESTKDNQQNASGNSGDRRGQRDGRRHRGDRRNRGGRGRDGQQQQRHDNNSPQAGQQDHGASERRFDRGDRGGRGERRHRGGRGRGHRGHREGGEHRSDNGGSTPEAS